MLYFVGGIGLGSTRVLDMELGTFQTIQNELQTVRGTHACTLLESEGKLVAAGGGVGTDLIQKPIR